MHTTKYKNQEITQVIYKLIDTIIHQKKITNTNKGFKKVYDYKIFIDAFIKRLKTGNSWKELEIQFNISDTHLNRIFNEWTNQNIFKSVFDLFLKKYKCYIDYDEVYIDSTILLNKYGLRNTTGINSYEAKKHRSNKLSCIVSKNGIPLGIKLVNSQIHDIKILMDTLPKHTFFTTLIGDKAYISEKLRKQLKRNKRINLITDYRKNQKRKNNINTKSRITIEHFNSLIKQNKSINNRYDKYIQTYESIILLGCLFRGLQIVFNILYD
jgi:AraC-like DNA-binding protein